MKTLITSAALVLVAGSAFAMSNSQSEAAAERLLDRYGFDVSVSTLTDAQIIGLHQVDTSSDESDAAVKAQIASVLNK